MTRPPEMTTRLHELHNELTSEMIRRILEEPRKHGGDLTDSVIIVESLLVGVMLALRAEKQPIDTMVEAMITRARERFKFLDAPVMGNA